MARQHSPEPEDNESQLPALPTAAPMPWPCQQHADLLRAHGEMLKEVSGQLGAIHRALVGEVDSSDPGLREQIRQVFSTLGELVKQVKVQNGRVNGHEKHIWRLWFSGAGAIAVLSFIGWAISNGWIVINIAKADHERPAAHSTLP